MYESKNPANLAGFGLFKDNLFMNERKELKQNRILRNITLSLLIIALVVAAALITSIVTVRMSERAQEAEQARLIEEKTYIENNQGAGRRSESTVIAAPKQQPDAPQSEPEPEPAAAVTVDNFLLYDSLASINPEIDIYSTCALLLERESGTILYSKDALRSTYPASLTKIMTCILGIEHCADLNATVTITEDMLAGLLDADASVAGLSVGEEVQYIDLFYCLMLPSGADAANAIAFSLFGSAEAMVQEMNDMALRLGMVATTYTNVSGLHDVKMRTTATDVAILFNYALNNEIFRSIITKQSYTTAATNKHPDGMTVYGTMFSMLPITEFENGAVILGGKTGTTTPAGQCLASFGSYQGREYILVTLGAFGYESSQHFNIDDAMTIYSLLTLD